MRQNLKISSHLNTTLFFLYILFFAGMVFSFRAVSSISAGLILVVGMIYNSSRNRALIDARAKNAFLLFCTAFFIMVLVSVFFAKNSIEAWSQVRLKSGLLFIPLSLCCTDYIGTGTRRKLMKIFILLLAAAAMYCLVNGMVKLIPGGDYSLLFYHALVAPLRQHAILFSVYFFIAIVYVVENLNKKGPLFSRTADILLIIFFACFLFLLSSKLVLAFLLIYSTYSIIQQLRLQGKTRFLQIFSGLIILGGTLMLVTKNPVSSRFNEMKNERIEKFRQENFTPGDYYTPIQFRLLEWRFTGEILNENRAWLFGVSAGDAQNFLDKKYISKNMYIGEPERGDRGYLGYNTHNQFLQATLQFGIIGAVVMVLIAISMLRIIIREKKRELTFILLLLLAFLFTESLFETQYGLLLFTFFPIFLSLNGENELNKTL